jgi:hypothetical protein
MSRGENVALSWAVPCVTSLRLPDKQSRLPRMSSEETLHQRFFSQTGRELARIRSRSGTRFDRHAGLQAFPTSPLSNRGALCCTQTAYALAKSATAPPLECLGTIPVSGRRAEHETTRTIPNQAINSAGDGSLLESNSGCAGTRRETEQRHRNNKQRLDLWICFHRHVFQHSQMFLRIPTRRLH